MQIIVVTGI